MKCVIREWKTGDKADLAKILNNQNIQNNLRDGLPYPYTEDDAEEYIKSMLCADKSKTFAFAITAEDEDKVIGSISILRCENIHSKTAEIGYYISEPYWGKGYATNAVRQACRYEFENSDIIRIFAVTFSQNIGSCRVLEKAGFQYEGTLHSSAIKNGKILDMKIYAIIKANAS